MKIKTKLLLTVLVSLALLLTVGITLYWSEQEISRSLEMERRADEIMRYASELNITIDQYLLYPEERPKLQFQLIHAAVKRSLAMTKGESEEQSIIRRMRQNHEEMGSLFQLLVSTLEGKNAARGKAPTKELRERVVGQLLTKSREIISAAFQVSEISDERAAAVQQRAIFSIVIAIFISGVLMAVFSYLIGQSILRPINKLEEGTKLISSGSLHYQIDIERHDEVGQLSKAFNEMTNKLKTSYTSIEDLKQTEQALRQSESKYHSLFANMTNGFAYHKILCDDQGKLIDYIFLEINDAFEKLTGLKRENVIGKRVTEVLPGIEHHPADWIGIYGRVALTGEPIRFENYSEALKKWYSVSTYSSEKGYFAAIFEDITERKQREEEQQGLLTAVEQEKERLSALVNSITDEVWFANAQGRFTLANPSALREFSLGSTGEIDVESLAKSLEVYRPDGSPRPAEEAPPLRALKGEIVRNVEEIIRTPVSGELRYRQVSSAPVKDPSGNIMGSVSVARDITERKRMEEELRKSRGELEMRVQQRTAELVKANELLEGVFSSIDTMIAYMDKDFNFIRVNRAYAEADEQEPEFFVGKNHFVLFPNEENEQIFRKVVETGEPYSVYAKPFEYAEHPERGVTHWDWSLQPVKEPDGCIGGVVLSLVNVTDRISAEESVHQQAALLELAHDAIIVRDPEDRILFWNRAAEEMYGWGKDKALGAVMPDLLQTQYPKLLDEIKIDLIRKGQWEGELVHTRRDGKKIVVESRWALQKGKEGHPSAILQISRDMTERKLAQKALEAERQRFNDVLEMLPAYLVLLTPDHHMPFANRFFRERFGESHGRRCFEYLFDRSEPCETCETYTVLKTMSPHKWEWTGPDGRNYDVFDFPFTDTDGSTLILEMGIDITERKRAEEALRQAGLYARSLIEASLDPLVTISADGKVMDVNKATELVTGIPREQLIGTDFSKYFTEPEKARQGYEQVFRHESVRDYPLVIRHMSGKVTDVLYHATVFRNEAGAIEGVFAAARDVTEQKQIQKRIEATNALLNLFIKTSSQKKYLDAALELIQDWSGCRCGGIRVLDEQGGIPYESYSGFSREFWESENFLSTKNDQCICIRVINGKMDPQDTPVMTPGGSFCCGNTVRFVRQLSEEERNRYRGVCIDNGFLSVAIVPFSYGEKILGAIHLADETENKVSFKALEFIESMAPLIGEAIHRFNLEEVLHESENRLRLLSSQLLTVQEAERKRIAREIHDSIGQTLAAIKFGLESKLSQMSAGAPPPGVSIENIISLAQNGIEESRRIQMDLRPSILDDLGILATIGWFTREFQKVYSHISVEKEISAQENEVPESLKTTLFRVMQEAMNNVAKHSKADLVRLSLRKIESKIEMTIEDNGAGFDLENIKQGLGLTSMRERTELSGGTFEVQSTPRKGTVIRARWTL